MQVGHTFQLTGGTLLDARRYVESWSTVLGTVTNDAQLSEFKPQAMRILLAGTLIPPVLQVLHDLYLTLDPLVPIGLPMKAHVPILPPYVSS